MPKQTAPMDSDKDKYLAQALAPVMLEAAYHSIDPSRETLLLDVREKLQRILVLQKRAGDLERYLQEHHNAFMGGGLIADALVSKHPDIQSLRKSPLPAFRKRFRIKTFCMITQAATSDDYMGVHRQVRVYHRQRKKDLYLYVPDVRYGMLAEMEVTGGRAACEIDTGDFPEVFNYCRSDVLIHGGFIDISCHESL